MAKRDLHKLINTVNQALYAELQAIDADSYKKVTNKPYLDTGKPLFETYGRILIDKLLLHKQYLSNEPVRKSIYNAINDNLRDNYGIDIQYTTIQKMFRRIGDPNISLQKKQAVIGYCLQTWPECLEIVLPKVFTDRIKRLFRHELNELL